LISTVVTEPNSLPSSLAFALSEQTVPTIASAFDCAALIATASFASKSAFLQSSVLDS
jgi:hypothetical protein